MKRLAIISVVLMLVVSMAACGTSSSSGNSITVSDAWARPSTMMDHAGAAYMVLQNNGTTEDKLLAVESDVAQTIELHQTTADSGGMMSMSPVSNIPVPANGKTELKPGGFHVMLINLTRELKAGDKIQFTLNFEKAGKVPVTAEVKDQ
ncbi:MAG TPA: copper chaperone PCu(A)C [Anaerolineae bacterium]|nr:copper chaperone PCu(A)C [Anaerolineae bacterium]